MSETKKIADAESRLRFQENLDAEDPNTIPDEELPIDGEVFSTGTSLVCSSHL